MAVPRLPPATATLTLWLLAKVFASGCTAMTGVEAVSNGVMAFRDPTTVNAKRTLTVIIALLIVLLLGIAFMCQAYGIGATDPEGSSYQSVLSQLTTAVAGRGIFYYVTIASILLVLSLSANTAFADFPRLTRAVALNDYLPHLFALRGRRLLYSAGVYGLGLSHWRVADSFSWSDRPAHSSLRHWSFPGLYPFPGWNGHALEA